MICLAIILLLFFNSSLGRRSVQMLTDLFGLKNKVLPDDVFWMAEEAVCSSVASYEKGSKVYHPAGKKRSIRKKPAASFVVDRDIRLSINASGRTNESVSGMGRG